MPKDTNPKLTKSYKQGKAVAEKIYGGNAEKALRNGWQYENAEKNHHKRGVPVRTNDQTTAHALPLTRRTNDVQRGNKTLKQR